jgi:hypothetical protein
MPLFYHCEVMSFKEPKNIYSEIPKKFIKIICYPDELF